ncbi:hypothetical protein NPIL_525891 [Nephila pilipes]|uniref:Uncharacterized protein n=1 Tax=Nephila pilipes TaxID=299642 RepID=A0A8X6PVW9_NEPPI|nr:hypothetical protein NPIL_525891 [Nephila pilipes]
MFGSTERICKLLEIRIMNPDFATPMNGVSFEVPDAKRILVIGSPGVGKTSLIKTYLKYNDTKELAHSNYFYLKLYLTKIFAYGDHYFTYLIDLPPNISTPERIQNYPLVDAVILCFALDDRTSLANVEDTWLNDLSSILPSQANSIGVPVILAGLKKDLRSVYQSQQAHHMIGESDSPIFVTYEEGKAVSAQNNFEYYFESSSETQENVLDTINHALYAALEAV